MNAAPAETAFSPFERHFANLMTRLGGGIPELALAAALVCRWQASGHVCLDLPRACRELHWLPPEEAGALGVPEKLEPHAWAQALRATSVVGAPEEHCPLILDGERLYLNRLWKGERELIRRIEELLISFVEVDEAALREGLASLEALDEAQLLAVAVAALRRFCIITGGPGTGKTTIISQTLRLIAAQRPGLRVYLAAFTGKAVMRLRESLAREAGLPGEVLTLHRLLGVNPVTGVPRHNEKNPLPCDLLVIDEASMVDLELMVATLRALPPDARLILLGDQHQLASVGAGNILGDLCGERTSNIFSPDFTARLVRLGFASVAHEAARPLDDAVVVLEKSYRFDGERGIGRAARLVKSGQGTGLWDMLSAASSEEPCRLMTPVPVTELASLVVERELDYYKGLFASADPEEFLHRFRDFAVLCSHRQGTLGAESFNTALERELQNRTLIGRRGGRYHARPIMVVENNYQLDLFNGDIGVIFHNEACFLNAEGRLVKFSPFCLPACETVFAMTVHKSQGSEFNRVLLVLADSASGLLTRELVYTGLTRAREAVTICAAEETLKMAVRRQVTRISGLRDHFWG
ncbi:MAG: exodeoxyribonuclease V subunit alpha [bacterium]|nr:exodeoxyribonuclease V subunit alpha [bacterium]